MPVTKADRQSLAREMLGRGAPIRAVLAGCGVRQSALVARTRLAQARVSRILGSAKWARKEGRENAERVFRAAARALGVELADIPEWVALYPEAA